MIRWFIDWNIAICNRIEWLLPWRFRRNLHRVHEQTAARIMNERPALRVADLGSGLRCPFAEHKTPGNGTEIVAVDILPEALARNATVDHRVAADLCCSLPFHDATMDLIVSRSLVEHLEDNEAFCRECERLLRPGGRAVHIFPCRFAPFAIINQLLPHRLSQRIVHFVFPSWKEDVGFRAYYRNCSYPRFIRLLERSGLQVEEVQLRYYQSIYYKFFVPLYLISLIYDLAIWALGVKILACQMLVVADKPRSVAGGMRSQ